jgi:polyisoprenoid-binding protein YceI
MRTPLLSVLATGLLMACPALAQTIATRNPDRIEAGAYDIDPAHTQVNFQVSHLGFTTFRGRFDETSGTLQLDSKKPSASSLEVTVQTSSVDTPVAKLNEELKGAQWLDAQKFPQITFKSTRVQITGPHEAKVTGDLTLHGVTRPLTLAVSLHGGGDDPIAKKYTVGFELSGKILRSDYGVKTYLPLIGDEVGLIISASFQKQG